MKKPLKSEEILFYLHIPKCAGTTLINIIDQFFTENQIYQNHYYVKKLELISPEELNSYRFIRGHFPFDRIMHLFNTKPRLITFLRDPVIRFVSNFEMRQKTFDPGFGRNDQKKIFDHLKNSTLSDFVDNDEMLEIFSNRMTKFIGGRKKVNSKFIPNIERAKDRLENDFDFIGLTSDFDSALSRLTYYLDLPEVGEYKSLNISPNRNLRDIIPKEILSRVAEINWADVELYEHAKKFLVSEK